MEFELKDFKTTGWANFEPSSNTFTQFINIEVGVKDCPYNNIKAVETIAYTFDATIPTIHAMQGIQPFCEQYVAINYPNI